jgi:hypothetical protein
MATLSRGGCYGRCPVYEIWIYPDGRVLYHGDMHVRVRGYREWRIPRERLAQLRAAFARSRYWNLPTYRYNDGGPTCQPTAYTSYRSEGGEFHHVVHYLGNEDAPEALFHVEDEIDRIVEIERWIGTPEDARAADNRRDWL